MNWLNYLLQVNLYLTLSVGFYWLVLRKETFFQLNRSFLLGASLISFIVPFWKMGIIQDWLVTEQVSEAIAVISLEEFRVSPLAEKKPVWSWNMVAVTIYFLGFGYGLLRFATALFKLQQLLRISHLDGQAFSVFGKIFIDKKLPDYQTIKSHEDVHSRQFHSMDVFWFELVCTVCWFNPVAHWLRNEIKLIHELIADEEAALFAGKSRYAEILVATHFKTNANSLVNNFFSHKILKTRIMKLAQQKSKRTALVKYAFAMPLFLTMLIFSAASKAGNLPKGISENLFNEIKGQVTDENGEPLPGAHVVIRGTNIGTSTDLNGFFKLKEVSEGSEIALSFVGYQTVIISVSSAEQLKIVLLPVSYDETQMGSSSGNTNENFKVVEDIPAYPGGLEALHKFISSNLNYPEEARKANVEGKVIVKFVIQKNGSIGKSEILKGLGYGCDEEVLRILNLMPKWTPGYQNGMAVNTWFTLPVVFSMNNKNIIQVMGKDGQKPLYIVNGKEVIDIEGLNPDEIENVNVLKGETAEKLYGSKGANGVVQITLKKK